MQQISRQWMRLPRLSFGRLSFGLVFALAVLFSGQSARAQFGGSVNGTVQDSTGAVIPNAMVTLTNVDTSQARTATSDGKGAYTFTELGPGTYTVAVTAPNFKAAMLSNVMVAAETPRTADVTLSTGDANTSVTVNADDRPSLQTSDASIGSTLNQETIERLPTTGGDVYELLRTAPGITGDSARSGSGTAVFLPNGAGAGQSNRGIFQTENQVQISSAGQTVADNDYLIDGVSVNSLGQAGAAVVTPNQESVGQISVVATSYSAEDGRNSGAHIKTVSKSGTNTIHGSAYFRYNEPGLNAYNQNTQGPGGFGGALPIRVNNKSRDYAGSLGGPIRKDKAFLFASYEGFSLVNNTFTNAYVESPQYDAAILATQANSVSGRILASGGIAPRIVSLLPASCALYSNQGLPCRPAGNGIDVGSFAANAAPGTYFFQRNCDGNPATPACAAGYPVGAGGFSTGNGLDGVPDLVNAELLIPQRAHASQYNGRFDYSITPKDQFAASVYVTKLDNYGISGSAGSRPQGDLPFKPLNEAITAIYIHTFSANILNEARGNATRFADNAISDAAGTVNYGIPYINIQNTPTGDVQYGIQQTPTSPAVLAENTYEVRDTVSFVQGSRTLKIGGEYRWEQDNNNLSGNVRPVYAFQGLFNFAQSAPTFEAISADPTTGGPANTQRYLRSETLGLFVQHDWKITPTFTLNTGIRYEYFSPFHNKGTPINYPVLGPPGSELTAAVLSPHNNFFNPDYSDISPKFGFAWVPTGLGGKTVFRGGVERAFNRLNFSTLDNAVEDGPGYFSYGICCGQAAADNVGSTSNGPFALGRIQYGIGTSNSASSFTPNPALRNNVVNGLPVDANGVPIGIEVYGSSPDVRIPYAYVYSLDIQQQVANHFVMTFGFQGSTSQHLPRLVDQNFLYAQPTNIVFTNAYFLTTDSYANYAAGTVHAAKTFNKGYQIDLTYRYSKSLDQVSNGSGADSLANQTDPANNRTEYGPSDYDTRHLVTITGLWDIPGYKGENRLLKVATNGFQINGIFTFHTGFPFTPVTNNFASNPNVASASTINPTRPYAYLGGFQGGCGNANFLSGNDVRNTSFILGPPTGTPNRPGIGRNSFSGPCYTDTDLSFARQQKFTVLDRSVNLRFQANFFNTFNTLNLQPFTNGNAGGGAQIVGADPNNPTDAANRATSNFGKPTSADAGRQIEFFARLQF